MNFSQPQLQSTAGLAALVEVTRDGNPKRRLGHTSPYAGKLGPLNAQFLDFATAALAATLPPAAGPVLVIGLAESSLILAWWLARRLGAQAQLCFSTREPVSGALWRLQGEVGLRRFEEPHSHGPSHYLGVPVGARFAQVVIVEDEITTGVTLRNLILAIRDLSDRFRVVALADQRPLEAAALLAAEMATQGIELTVSDLSGDVGAPASTGATGGAPAIPIGRSATTAGDARARLEALDRRQPLDTLFVIGECVEVPLAFWSALPAERRPAFRHVTRSPWLVDGRGVWSRQCLENRPGAPPFFLYNWAPATTRRAAIIGDAATRAIATALEGLLARHGVCVHTVLVPPA